MLMAAGTLNAQETDSLERDTKDSTAKSPVEMTEDGALRVRIGESDDPDEREDKKDKRDKPFKFGIFNGVDFGFNTFMVNGDLNLPSELDDFEHKIGNSTNVQLRFLHLDFRPSEHMRLNFAVGLDYNDWALERDLTLQPDRPQVTFARDEPQFSKNKLKAKYLIFPLNVQFKTSNKITFTAGFEPQFLLRGRVKQISEERGKTKVDDNFNLREFRYAWVGRIGYDGFSLFCRYYPRSIFADGEGPDMQNIALGVGFGL